MGEAIQDSHFVTKGELQQSIENAIRETAPLVEGYPVLEQWLRDNGINYAFDSIRKVWISMEWGNGREGIRIVEEFNNFPDFLAFALEFVKQNIQHNER